MGMLSKHIGLGLMLGLGLVSTYGPAHAQTLTHSSQSNQSATANTDRFILKLKDSVELSAKPTVRRLEKESELLNEILQANRLDATWLRAGTLGTHVLKWGASVRMSDRESMLNRIKSDPRVEFAEADLPMSGMALPNDASFGSQWALQSTANRAGARFDKAWDLVKGSSAVIVAVVDTGVRYDTPELSGRLLAGYDFISDALTASDGDGRDSDPSDMGDWVSEADKAKSTFSDCPVSNSTWHGTFIAGQIAGVTQNLQGISAGDWNAKILPVRVSGKCRAFASDMYDGMLWSAGVEVPGVPVNTTPASIINVSLGAPVSCSNLAQSVVDRIKGTGALLVSSGGNGGGESFLPANCAGVMSVGAVDRDGSRAFYSAIGPTIDISAPGGYFNGLLGVGNSGDQGPESPRTVSKTGTSFASPLVAAAAALVKAANPSLTGDQIEAILLSTVQPFLNTSGQKCVPGQGKAVCDCSVGVCGAGMLDAHAAVRAARGTKPLANASVGLNSKDSSKISVSALDSTTTQGRTIASYRWEQMAGTPLLKVASAEAVLNLDRPATSSDLVFRLTVTDSVGETHSSVAAFRVSQSDDYSKRPAAAMQTISSAGGEESAPVGQAPSASAGGVTAAAVSQPSSSGGGGGALGLMGLFGLAALLSVTRRARI
ncbi:MAG: S8 family serine peptidase [Limnobacter sp.]|nr:S8 family serine peptidase [Limnobacter sp.]